MENTVNINSVPEELSRTASLLGEAAVSKIMNSTAAVFGLGGVGGQAAEALCRSGVGRLLLIDSDTVSRSNINRQIIATQAAIGRKKTDVCRERLLSINPNAEIITYDIFYDDSTAAQVPLAECDCVIDAIDTVSSKLLLITSCSSLGVQIVSCMGAGNKLDPSRFESADIYETSVCPLARVMRTELRRRGIPALRVIYSREPAIKPEGQNEPRFSGRPSPGSASFCAPAAGLLAAAEAIKLIINKQ